MNALLEAVRAAGGLHDVLAVSVSGQQHTPIFLDETGTPVAASPLWNDVGSHPHMVALNAELGPTPGSGATGLPLTLSDTVVKARWLRDEFPDAAARTAAIAVVHDWLTWRLRGFGPGTGGVDNLVTDRSEASGTGYWSGETGEYTPDLLVHAFGRPVVLPVILGPLDRAGVTAADFPASPRAFRSGSAAEITPPQPSRSDSKRVTPYSAWARRVLSMRGRPLGPRLRGLRLQLRRRHR